MHAVLRAEAGNLVGLVDLSVRLLCCRSRHLADALGESSADAFLFREDALVWRQRAIGTAALAETRQRLFRSFGSCAIREPIDELAKLRLLP